MYKQIYYIYIPREKRWSATAICKPAPPSHTHTHRPILLPILTPTLSAGGFAADMAPLKTISDHFPDSFKRKGPLTFAR